MTKKTKTVLVAASQVVIFSVFAYIIVYLIREDVDSVYGTTLFVVLPALAGVVAGWTTSTVPTGLLAFLGGLAFCLASLLIFAIEGILCIVFASPLILILGIGGVFLGRYLGKFRGGSGSAATLLLCLLIVGCSTLLEGSGLAEVHVVETIRDMPEKPQRTWETMVAIDEITGKKPLLLQLGLPVPQYCTIEGSGVGAIRTCFFDQGYIKERISVWDPPRRLVMSIVEVTLPGRDWLQFIDASYELSAVDERQTRIRRTTQIASVLRPRVYWKRLEALAMQAEHEYLFNGIVEKLGGIPETGVSTIQDTSEQFPAITQAD